MKIIYILNKPELGPFIIISLIVNGSPFITIQSILDNEVLDTFSSESLEELRYHVTGEYGEIDIREFDNPVSALMDMANHLHKHSIYEYHKEVNTILDNLAASGELPTLHTSDAKRVQFEEEYDEYLVRLYDAAVKEAKLSGFPLWISDAYYGIDLSMK